MQLLCRLYYFKIHIIYMKYNFATIICVWNKVSHAYIAAAEHSDYCSLQLPVLNKVTITKLLHISQLRYQDYKLLGYFIKYILPQIRYYNPRKQNKPNVTINRKYYYYLLKFKNAKNRTLTITDCFQNVGRTSR